MASACSIDSQRPRETRRMPANPPRPRRTRPGPNRSDLLHGERALHRFPSAARDPEPDAVREDDRTAPVGLAMQLADALDVHDERAMHPDELARLEQPLQRVHAL